jgi:hypothetical protein
MKPFYNIIILVISYNLLVNNEISCNESQLDEVIINL